MLAYLSVPGSVSVLGETVFKRKRGSIAHSLSLSSSHLDMTEILLKRTQNPKPFLIHSSFYCWALQRRRYDNVSPLGNFRDTFKVLYTIFLFF